MTKYKSQIVFSSPIEFIEIMGNLSHPLYGDERFIKSAGELMLAAAAGKCPDCLLCGKKIDNYFPVFVSVISIEPDLKQDEIYAVVSPICFKCDKASGEKLYDDCIKILERDLFKEKLIDPIQVIVSPHRGKLQ